MSIVFLIIFSLAIGTLCYALERQLIDRIAIKIWYKNNEDNLSVTTYRYIAKVLMFTTFSLACFLVLLAYELCKTLYLQL